MSRCYLRCRSHAGTPKTGYKTFDQAKRVAEERGWAVDIYACPWQQGRYHITHKPKGEANDDNRSA